MAPLGWWVSVKASSATEVALTRIDGIACPDLLVAGPKAQKESDATGDGSETGGDETVNLLEEDAPEDPPPEEVFPDEVSPDEASPDEVSPDEVSPDEVSPDEVSPDEASPDEASPDEASPDEERERPRIKVDIYEDELPVVVVGEMVEAPITQEEIDTSLAARNTCLADIDTRRDAVMSRKFLITMVMMGSALLLLLYLAFYGIMSTHKVAGPLFKTSLYFRKLEDNIYDTVYDLRKGDQLVEFYEHFKEAHVGVTKMQTEDRDRLQEAIALAKDSGLEESNPKIATITKELERLLAQKEESLDRIKK